MTAPKVYHAVPTEQREQQTVVEWLRLHRILHYHAPAGEVRPKRVDRNGREYCLSGQRLASMGTTAGFPDLLIFDPPPHDAAQREIGAAIEMKRVKGGKVSQEQQEWIRALEERHWACKVAHGAGEAIAFLENLGYGKRR